MALRDDLQHWKEIGGRIWRQKFWEYVFKEDHRSGSQPVIEEQKPTQVDY